MTDLTGLDLTRKLIAFNTISPPGDEAECARFIADLLETAGFQIAWHDWQPNRPNLIATLPATEEMARGAIVYSGHLDTVPLGQVDWSEDPFAGEIKDGRMYGRGTSDMKSGVAGCIMAGLALAQEPVRRAEVKLIFSAGEETGCEGVLALAEHPDLLGTCDALVVAEPTDNRPFIGHKGALWMSLVHKGVTAHGSMPEKGKNAIFAACASIDVLRGFDFGVEAHPVMGGPSLNVGNMSAGLNINSVPDLARVGVDIRSTVGQSNAQIKAQLGALLGDDVDIEPMTDMDHVYTDPDHPWMQQAFSVVEEVTGQRPEVGTATYFTDASVLKPAMGDPATLIIGPGAMAMAHQTDEYFETALMDPCVEVFTRLGRLHIM
ncbi:M20 family metallopeptidase [Roseovarius gahaiensis]|uniref:M20 family metallopeptidase n=1 Tax=Roseovarius gahaiensis TaxID=2716691 RepID=A0A967EKQ4_9RHOB|nr:M20 family metallopeptidase [Roseovarius gahaiensis]NHQ74839.1 M20 family metallopeptidase [Roseovarius gahaiensis]